MNATETKESGNKTKEEQSKPKLVTVKEPVTNEEIFISEKKMSPEQYKLSIQKLKELNKADADRARRENALNQLETLVIDARTKLEMNEYSEAGTQEEIEKIIKACNEISDWLYEDGADADAVTYEKKITEIEDLTNTLYARVWEHHERPEALKALHQMLNGSVMFLENAKNLTKTANPDKDIFTEVEIETLSKVITETTQWRDKQVEEQTKKKKSEPVLLTVKMISEKMATLDREVKYLVNKLKIWRPKVPEKTKEEKKNKTDSKKTEEKDTTDQVTPGTETKDEKPVKEEETINVEDGEDDPETHSEL